MYIGQDGFVGIGTVQPSSTLHVAGTLTVTATSTFAGSLKVLSTGAGTPVIFEVETNASTGTGNTIAGIEAGDSITSGSNMTFFGVSAGSGAANFSGSTAVGYGAYQIGNQAYDVAIGYAAINEGTVGGGNTAVGSFAGLRDLGTLNVFVGYNAGGYIDSSTADGNVMIGANTGPTGFGYDVDNTILIGNGAGASFAVAYDDCLAIGQSAPCVGSNTANFGSHTAPYTNFYFNGATATGTDSIVLNAAGGSGTDIAGASFTIAGGRGTGTGAGGAIRFDTANASGTGAVLNATATRMYIGQNGFVGIGMTTPSSTLHIGSGQILVPIGSVGAPSYSFSGDTNTGIYGNAGSDWVQFAAGGVNALNILSTLIAPNVDMAGYNAGPQLLFSGSGAYSLTAPTISPITVDPNTGIAGNNADGLSIVAGGIAMVYVSTSTVGIGTTRPSSTLHVIGTSTFTGNVFLNSTSSGLAIATSTMHGTTSTLTVCARSNCTTPSATTSTDTVAFFASTGGLTTDPSIIARGTITSGQADFGEYIQVVGDPTSYDAGDVLRISPDAVTFEKSDIPNDPRLAGIVTETAGIVAGGGEDNHGQVVIALAGRVPVKVSLENGPIHIGDPLTASSETGVAMKQTEPGMFIGYALEEFPADNSQQTMNSASSSQASTGVSTSTPKIVVFVKTGFSLGTLDNLAVASSTPPDDSQSLFVRAVFYALDKLGAVIRNGIATINELITKRVTTDTLCVGSTCVDEEQLKQILQAISAAPAVTSAPTPTPAPSTSAPTDASTETVPTTSESSSTVPTPTAEVPIEEPIITESVAEEPAPTPAPEPAPAPEPEPIPAPEG
jgi:hypothetical protein